MSPAIIPLREPRALAGLAVKPPTVFLPDEKAGERFFGFFTAHIRNRNTRRAYYKAACRFSDWCEDRLLDLAGVKPPHIAAICVQRKAPRRTHLRGAASTINFRADAHRER